MVNVSATAGWDNRQEIKLIVLGPIVETLSGRIEVSPNTDTDHSTLFETGSEREMECVRERKFRESPWFCCLRALHKTSNE